MIKIKLKSELLCLVCIVVVWLMASFNVHAQRTITGTVTDLTTGEMLTGVSVVQGAGQGTTTDVNGKYTIRVADQNAQLVFSYVGYLSETVTVGDKTSIDIKLVPDIQKLDEIVVVGYGTVKKRDLTGSISSIKSQDITSIPTTNALESLQGKIAGLDMTRSSGQAGAGLSFTIRGERSLAASNAPLILVDGIDYGATLDLNPSDIESMEVLKDASSTAIYGTRGANGVIIITTRHGVTGKTKISFNSYYSVNSLTGMPKMMTGEQYVALKREAYRTTGKWNSAADDGNVFAPAELQAITDHDFVDWMGLVIQKGNTQNYELSLSGGNDKTTCSFSLGYMDEIGLMKTNDEQKRYNGRLALDYKITDKLITGANVMFTYKNQDQRFSPINMASKILPIAMPYNSDGTVNPYPAPGYTSQMSPLLDDVAGAVSDNYNSTRFFGTAYLQWELLKNLTFKTNAGVDFNSMRRGYFYDKNTLKSEGKSSMSGDSINLQRNLTWENTLNYSFRPAENHDIQLLAGNTIIDKHQEVFLGSGRDQTAAGNLFYNIGSNGSEITIKSVLLKEELASFFGRVNYKFKDRYLLTASFRTDGSSLLAEGHKWGNFPSVAAAWKVKEEPFMTTFSKLSNLKLRFSWGESGKSAVSPYQTLGGLGNAMYAFVDVAAYGYYPRLIPNPLLTWETTGVYDAGLDLGFFDNRISATVDLYLSQTRNLLLPRLLPSTTGYQQVLQNIGKTEGRGIDVSLNTINIKSSNISWTTDFTFTYNTNKITELSSGTTQDVGNKWFVGKPLKVEFDYKKTGIWQTGQEAAALKLAGEVPGDIRVQDMNNDSIINADDRVTFNKSPKFTFGLNNKFSFRNIELSVFIYGRYNYYINYEYYKSFKSDGLENGAAVDYWTPENASNAFPRPNKDKAYQLRSYFSSLAIVKGDFLKIRDITLAYNLPKSICGTLKIANLRVYGTLKNFFTFSDLKDYDPERGGALSYPLTKQVVMGINLDF